MYTHLNPPSALTPTTDYLLFHSGVRRPVWEDPLNLSGGKWIIRLKKGISDRLWEDIILAVLGEQFDDLQPPVDEESDEWPGICGCTISVRPSEDIISVWNRYEGDTKIRDKIKYASYGTFPPPLLTILVERRSRRPLIYLLPVSSNTRRTTVRQIPSLKIQAC